MYALAFATLSVFTFSSCDKDDDISLPTTEGNTVTMRNTYNDSHVPEISYASYIDYAFMGSDVEFPEAFKSDLTSYGGPVINALYSINFTENTIEYKLLPDANDPFWIQNYRVLEAGVYDRYYLTFKNPHGVKSFTSTDPAVNVRIDSDNILVVEVGEGFDFKPGAAFTIILN